jgi:hypothetical protein
MWLLALALVSGAALAASVTSPTQAAQLVFDELLRGSIEGRQILVLPSLVEQGRTIDTWHQSVTVPFDGYLVLVDDMALANWEHPCRWVFVSAEGLTQIVNLSTPPVALDRMTVEYSDLPVVQNVDERQRLIDAWVPNPSEGNDPAHTYAWIISGGANQSNNHIRYYGDVQFLYMTLTDDYGYTDDHIIVCFADGTNPAIDNSSGQNSNPDLDGDGDTDIDYDATTAGVTSGFNAIDAMVSSDDHLLVFTTDHGGSGKSAGNNPPEVILNLWNSTLDDDTMEGWLNGISAASIHVGMEQCFSGGFLAEVIQGSGPRTFASAANGSEYSWAGNTFPQYDEWCYWWTGAFHGSVPAAGSYPGGALPGEPDMNSDGYVSYYEAAYRAEEWDAYAQSGQEHPQWDDIPDSIGDDYYLGGLIPTTGIEGGPVEIRPASLGCAANPFTGSAVFNFTLGADTNVNLSVMDMSGRTVATLASGPMASGEHSVPWEASSAPAGLYIIRFSAGGSVESMRVVKF